MNCIGEQNVPWSGLTFFKKNEKFNLDAKHFVVFYLLWFKIFLASVFARVNVKGIL